MRRISTAGRLATMVMVVVGVAAGAGAAGWASPAADVESMHPLSDYVGFGITDSQREAEEAQYDAEDAVRSRMIADCMVKAGFVYTERPSSILVTEDMTEEQLVALAADPDSEYLAGLSVEELQAYNITLTGFKDPNDPSAGAAQGCVGAAHEALPGVYATRSRLTEELVALEAQVRSDNLVLAAKKLWAECMSDTGWWVPDDLALGPRAYVDSGQIIDEKELASYMEASDACAVTVGLVDVESEVRRELELDFIDRHQDELERRSG